MNPGKSGMNPKVQPVALLVEKLRLCIGRVRVIALLVTSKIPVNPCEEIIDLFVDFEDCVIRKIVHVAAYTPSRVDNFSKNVRKLDSCQHESHSRRDIRGFCVIALRIDGTIFNVAWVIYIHF
jgi:hypothetical protein